MSNTVVSEFIAVRWSNFINNYVTAGFVYFSVWVVVLSYSLSLSLSYELLPLLQHVNMLLSLSDYLERNISMYICWI